MMSHPGKTRYLNRERGISRGTGGRLRGKTAADPCARLFFIGSNSIIKIAKNPFFLSFRKALDNQNSFCKPKANLRISCFIFFNS